ncbi:restriction endonuclease subunit S [Thomasclavelia cocleata]|uniref:Type I restriction enzyme, S subunit n=1 Tax=Thomasclavelia cocleata TaxID=69824 RepID=A0A1I0EZR5_9FIRM|nr:restriction endonuclease subunit S [Thomasclavelia cocleata]MCR1960342.1 restriction endonuclease subunit S [Thomasclavelia cocleata]NDO42863.1 restriction endonuclease subunit S [Thomasclavelia cocleata]PJN80657.1 restriction endonuclease subunit S [Thomasclavelia cocleata]SET51015.1 type I restriction enzyme, S subunit [Thomasclavelia cocleata]
MREMKDSGIEWIGEIPKDWKLIKIGNIYDERNIKVSDKDYEPLSVTKNGIVLQLESAAKSNDNDNRKLIRKNDFVINSRSDRRGSCGISNYDGSCSLINTVLKPRDHMINQYYNYVFRSELFADEFYKWGNGIVNDLWSTKWSSMKKIYIPFPNLTQQQSIANYLDDKCEKIDRMIAKEKEEIEKLNEYKDSLIEITITKGLNKKVNMVKSELKWIDEIPKDWKKYKLSQLCSSKKYSMVDGPFGSDMKNEEYVDEGVPIVQLTNIKKYNHYTEKLKFITRDKHLQLKRHTALKGDIAIAKMMPAGRACILDDLYDEYVVAADAIRFSPNEIKVDKRFVLYCLNTYGMVECELESKGTTRIRISLDIARNIKLYLPKLEEQTSIADFLDKKCNEIEKTIKLKEVKIEKVEAYKKSLIYECVTGKREVE